MTPQRTWLVECYSPGIDRAAVASAGARARAAAAALGADDARVEYLGALLVARDEVVFHAFAAPDPGLVHELSELGVILLMFTVGTELRLSALARVGAPAALTALFEVALVIALGTLVARLLGFSPGEAVFAGACLGISSTMLVAKAFEELGWKGGFTDIVFAILVFEDLIAILLLAILAGVANGSGLAAPEVAILIGKLAGFLAVMLAVGLLVVPRCLRWIAQRARSETLLIAALAVCFGTSALAASAGSAASSRCCSSAG